MSMLFYLHGFNSSPQSKKALETGRWKKLNTPDIEFCCPQLSPYASEAMDTLKALVEDYLPEPVYLVGSSMGGFFATCLVEQYNLPAVLINPAVNPSSGLHSWLGENRNFITGERWFFEPQHIEQYRDLNPQKIKCQKNYKILLQTGDEVLDYRHAQERYKGCAIETEVGGDHSFVDYQQHIPAILKFLTHVQTCQ